MRQSRRPKRRGLVVSLVLSFFTVVLPLGLYVWGSHSGTFAVQKIELRGAQRVSPTAAMQLLEKRFAGRNLFTIGTGAVRDTLAPLLFVAGVRVDRSFPSTLKVTVTEHVPALYALAGERWYVISTVGVVLGAVRDESRKPGEALASGPIDAKIPLPAVAAAGKALEPEAVTDDPEVDAALSVLRALPDRLRMKVASVRRVSSGLRLKLRTGVVVDLGPDSRLVAKAAALDEVLAFYGGRHVAAHYVDVSVPDRPLGRPVL